MSRSWMSCFLCLLLVSLYCGVASGGTYTVSPQVNHVQQAVVRSSPHLTFSLDANHHSSSSSPSSSFRPLSHSSSHSSRFTTLQHTLASANLTGCASIDFSALVSISSQGPYRLIVDTGSTTLAVVSSTCTNCDSAHPTYTPAAGTETNNEQSVSSSYGGGTNWTGHAFTANVAVSDSNSVSMAIATIESNYKFIDSSKVCAVNQDAQVGLNSSQGIIGFAYPTLAISGTDSWITNYVASTGISNEFTIQMCPTGGNLWIGSYDAAFIGSQFTYIPIVATNFYAVMLNDLGVVPYGSTTATTLGYSSTELGPCTGFQDCTIVDSGTTLIQLPTAIYNVLVSSIRSDAQYQAVFGSTGVADYDPLDPSSSQCAFVTSSFPSLSELQQKLPKLSLTFTDTDTGNTVTTTIAALPGYLSINYDEAGDTFYCRGIGPTSQYTILGYAFMNQFTIRHDLTNQRLGLALTAQCGVAAPLLPNYQWTTGEWSAECSVASCGGGVQWRSVDCTDIYNTKHPDIMCGTSYTAQRPADSRTCNTAACASISAAQFSAVTASSSSVEQGQTVTISYSYTGTVDFVTLFITPVESNLTQRSYVARNATGGTGSGTYSWYVPSTLPSGTYHLGAYTMMSYGAPIFIDSTDIFTVEACTSGSCAEGMDVCSAATCNGRGECDVSSDNTAVCSCVSAYNGTNCEQLVACNTQCINGGTVTDTSSCACVCPSGYTGALCEQIYANITATLKVTPSSIASTYDAAAFQTNFITDVAYALGLRPNAVVIQSVDTTSDGIDTVVAFQLTSMGSSDTLQASDDLLQSLLTSMGYSSTLSTGLTSAYVTSFVVVSGPPSSSSGSSSSIASKYWPFILAGVGGFLLIFFVLYCVNGGRCAGCRRDKVDADLTRLGPKGSGSLNKNGQVVAGGGGGHAPRKHERKPTHEPRHSYFQGAKPVAV